MSVAFARCFIASRRLRLPTITKQPSRISDKLRTASPRRVHTFRDLYFRDLYYPRAYGARSMEEEKAAIVRACSEVKRNDDALGQAEAEKLSTELESNASPQILNDGEVAIACVGVYASFLDYFSENLRADKGTILRAMKINGFALQYASAELRGDKEVVLAAVNNDGRVLVYASEELRADKDVVLAAVNNDGRVLVYASKELRADKEVVLAAVNNYGAALVHASEGLQRDKEVVLAAVHKNGGALKNASEELRGDKEVVLTAVNMWGLALEHASEDLRGDKEVVLAAVKNSKNKRGEAIEYASEKLRGEKAFLLLAARCAALDDWLGPDLHHFYDQAGPSVKNALSMHDFFLAAKSKLAVPGQSEPAPTLLVTLTSMAAEHTESGSDDGFHAEAKLGLSGEKFVFDLPARTWSGALVYHLAEELVDQLERAGKAGGRIFINFVMNEDGGVVAVPPWECKRPLRDFLTSSGKGTESDPPRKQQRT